MWHARDGDGEVHPRKKNKEKLRQALTRGQGLLCWRIGFSPSVQEWNGQVSARRGEELHELAGPEVSQSGVSPSRSGRRAQHNTVILHKSPIRELGTPEARRRCFDPWAIHGQPIHRSSERKCVSCVRACRASVSTCRDLPGFLPPS
jgi:hypothetical protein